MDLDSVADELYGLRPEEFVAARDRRARDARESGERALAKEIGALRRPSLAAWAGDLLVRRRPEEVGPLLGLGEELRRAHRELDGARLRELARRQGEVIGALGRQAAGWPSGRVIRWARASSARSRRPCTPCSPTRRRPAPGRRGGW